MQRFVAEDSFWNLFPESALAVAVVHDLLPGENVTPDQQKTINSMLAQANEDANRYLTSETISQNQVVAVWRDAFTKFAKKKGARCTIENLLKRVLKGNPVGHITPIVDITNIVTLKYALPIGTEDTDKLQGDLRLLVTDGGDDFLPIGEDEPAPTLSGELCYCDDAGAVCRCWNWRDGQRTCIDEGTRNAIVIMEFVEPGRVDDLRAALDELCELLPRYLGGTVHAKGIATRDNPGITISED